MTNSSAPAKAGRVDRFSTAGELVKFAAVAGVFAMLADAVIGHALLWQNDPYWTYWVTDTLLITTVFSIGTALLGAGIARGALLTVVQMLVLTTYYWSLSPIGLPSAPEWLDLQHTWVTGPPVHFGVYYLGYLTALWLWRRRCHADNERPSVSVDPDAPQTGLATEAVGALLTAMGVVLSLGLLQTVALGEFPGATWFVMRTVILVPFILGWRAFAGHDRAASVAGGSVAAMLLVAYGHYLGPIGLPDTNLRVLAQDSPPADLVWLSYTDELLIMAPVAIVLAVAAFLISARLHGHRWTPLGLGSSTTAIAVAALGIVVAAGFVTAEAVEHDDRSATVASGGRATIQSGPSVDGQTVDAAGHLSFTATQRNTKRTPLPPHDTVDLEATVTHPEGQRYEITATDPMVNEPSGRFTTWGGVGFDRWHHGRSGIGTPELAAVRSEVAIHALGDVRADGEVIATGVAVHAMTVPEGGVELHVGDPTHPTPGLPNGHLRVAWSERDGDNPEGPERARHLLGGTVLLALIAAALTAAHRESKGVRAAREHGWS